MSQSPSRVFVREATPEEEATVRQHKEASVVESSQYRGSYSESHSLSNVTSFVGGFGDSILGSITIGETDPRRWHIAHVYVEPEAREVGIGDAMVNYVLALLKTRQATWISAQALPGDRAMKNLFERHGLVAQTISVGKSLIDPSIEGHASQ